MPSKSNNKKETTTILVAVATVGAMVVTMKIIKPAIAIISSRWYLQYLAYNKKKNAKEEEQSGMTVSGLFIHPVKSMRAVSLQEVELDMKGFVNDRRFMVVYPVKSKPIWKDKFDPLTDSTHRFLTQRQCPSLATIIATIDNDTLILKKTKMTTAGGSDDEIRLPLLSTTNQQQNQSSASSSSSSSSYLVGIWDDQVMVDDMGDEAAQFVQSIIDSDDNCRAGDEGDEATKSSSMYQNIRLVSHSTNDRQLNPEFTPSSAMTWDGPLLEGLSTTPQVSLTDGYPILIACQSSLDQLNLTLQQQGKDKIPMSRFRPNIVIKGTEMIPFEEDKWKSILIGNQLFVIVKACPRCKQSCTDQETGIVTKEPVQTMKSFRALGGGDGDVFFAQNAIPLGSNGTIRVGDTVHVLQTGEPIYR